MADLSQKARNSVALQQDVFRLAKDRYGLSVAVLSVKSGISKSTIRGWAENGTVMPLWAIGELGLPDELSSMLLDPWNVTLSTAPDEADGCLYDLAEEASQYLAEFAHATNPNGPGGAKIIPMERAKLGEKARRVSAKARKVS